MELDLRHREIRLPGDVTLKCKPLTLGAMQRWIVRAPKAGDMQGEPASRGSPVEQLADASVTDAALEILRESLVEMSGFSVRQPDGALRPGTLEDLAAGGGLVGAVLLIRAANELFRSSGLSEADLGNSSAAPTALPPAPPTART